MSGLDTYIKHVSVENCYLVDGGAPGLAIATPRYLQAARERVRMRVYVDEEAARYARRLDEIKDLLLCLIRLFALGECSAATMHVHGADAQLNEG